MNEILTDRGSNFMSKVLADYLGRLKVKHKLTSAFHPRTNAKAEHAMPALFLVVFINTVPLVSVLFPDSDTTLEQAAQGRVPAVRELRKVRAIAEQRLKDNAARDKTRWDAHMKPQVFAVGDHAHAT
ncbi:hypothetical protein O0I10_012245 [Lichtheimia ornata]|uniref:Integrase catalytic domain-containing protein n=1 Tax=Lichtheimia ornata TaxID=688661 RepID=A0AAD7URE5_9FUNG|nr:uncharacterized protein O0I10_012245 [Lichtheimia ornata]KAJ8652137.1 hypothetical protein O0I10_012245 [Lichtheimia ornata]